MSDNVSQLHAQKHPGLGKRIAVFALLLVLVTGGVAAYVFRDRLNLDAEQFARADLNGNKTLEAVEVLTILQYANGIIGSLTL